MAFPSRTRVRLGPYGRRLQRAERLAERAKRGAERRIARLPQLLAREAEAHARDRRLASRKRLADSARRAAIASFIVKVIEASGVSVGIVAGPGGSPSVHVGALTARTTAEQLECEASFKAAVSRHLISIVLFAAEPAGRA